MNTRKSDLFDLDENIAALLVAVVPLAVSMIGFVSYVAWVVPLVALLMEKRSGLVRITAVRVLVIHTHGSDAKVKVPFRISSRLGSMNFR